MLLDLTIHRYPVYRDGQSAPVAWFSNYRAAAAAAEYRSSPEGNGGTGVPHWVEGPGGADAR